MIRRILFLRNMEHSLKLKWSLRSLSDIARIVDFISKDNPSAGQLLAISMRAKAEHLRAFPYLGKEVMPGVRELILHRNYLLTYRIKPGSVEIIQVWHVAQER